MKVQYYDKNFSIVTMGILLLSNTLAASVLPQGMEHRVSPCPTETYMKVRIPESLWYQGVHNPNLHHDIKLHGVILDEQLNRYLIYEPYGQLRQDARGYLYGGLAFATISASGLGLLLAASRACSNSNSLHPMKASIAQSLFYELAQYAASGILIGGAFICGSFIKYRMFKSGVSILRSWKDLFSNHASALNNHIPLNENIADTLKRTMLLPRGVVANRLCVQKLTEVEDKDNSPTCYQPVFQHNNALNPMFSACDQLVSKLQAISTRTALQTWCEQHNNPLDKLRHIFSQPVFQPLVKKDIVFGNTKAKMSLLQKAKDWLGLTKLRSYTFTTTNGEPIDLPMSVMHAIEKALKQTGLTYEILRNIEEFNKLLALLGKESLHIYATKETITRAYRRASLLLHPDKISQQHQEIVINAGFRGDGDAFKKLDDLYKKLCPS